MTIRGTTKKTTDVSDEALWIFGYGSLVWRPAFPHLERQPAWIEGYARRFWQGSTDHRGLPERPGRVVTLVAAEAAGLTNEPRCWGTAYRVPLGDPDGVLAGLDHRERGGYERVQLDMNLGHPGSPTHRVVSGLVYVAGPENENYLGEASVDAIARQIAGAVGPSGANPEYVFELAGSLREMSAEDAHVFAVEAALSALIEERA